MHSKICHSFWTTKKLSEINRDLIKISIGKDCSIILSSAKEKLCAEHNINISLLTIHHLMGEFNYSFKRIRLIPKGRNSPANIEICFECASKFITFDLQKCIFVDKMGVSISMRSEYCRSEIGISPRKPVSTKN